METNLKSFAMRVPVPLQESGALQTVSVGHEPHGAPGVVGVVKSITMNEYGAVRIVGERITLRIPPCDGVGVEMPEPPPQEKRQEQQRR